MLNFAVSHTEFLLNYLEQQPLLCPAALREHLMHWEDLDALLNAMEPDDRLMQMFLNGQIPPTHFLDDVVEFGRIRKRVNKHHFYDLLQNGATLVLNQIEAYSTAAKRLCLAVGKFAQQPTTSNAYISFGGSGTFGKHWDTHDVFAIQLVGKKRWQLYRPTFPLPLSHQTSGQTLQPPPAIPAFECTLSAGDLLYIPRGWWHQVTPLEVDSLHLSVGTYPPTLFDYVMWVCRYQLPNLIDARRSCHDSHALAAALEQVMVFTRNAVLDQHNINQFIAAQHARERLTGEFHTEFMVGKSAYTLSTRVVLTLSSIYPTYPADNHISVNGTRITLTPAGHAIVNLLHQNNALNWGNLCLQLSEFPFSLLQDTALELARYEVITLSHVN